MERFLRNNRLLWAGAILFLFLVGLLFAVVKLGLDQHAADLRVVDEITNLLEANKSTLIGSQAHSKALELKLEKYEKELADAKSAIENQTASHLMAISRADNLMAELSKLSGQLAEAKQELSRRSQLVALPDMPIWPPPTPSLGWTQNIGTLAPALTNWGSLAQFLAKQLGHQRLGYFLVPNGFAMVTGMSCVDDNGLPQTTGNASSNCLEPIEGFSRASFRAAAARLFASEAGRCRVVLYIVSDDPFGTPIQSAPNDISQLINLGANMLPKTLGKVTLSNLDVLHIYLYEFSYSPADGLLRQEKPQDSAARRASTGIQIK